MMNPQHRTALALRLPGAMLERLKPTKVFDSYWRFAVLRQEAFLNRMKHGSANAVSPDPIISNYKFTNVYRASDRVSQYLIRNVIYASNADTESMILRVLLFKLFNKIDTWRAIESAVGPIDLKTFDPEKIDRVLTDKQEERESIYSGAYIMPSGKSAFGYSKKHRNHLALLCKMLKEGILANLARACNLKELYSLLQDQPTLGPFLAFQLAVDIGYIDNDVHENAFVVAGPGALSGIEKCFKSTHQFKPEEIIYQVCENQEEEFSRRGLEFRNLFGRPLQPVDCQNLFCEVDKYARIYHPEIHSKANRTRIKQRYRPLGKEIDYWYPPKWGINDNMSAFRRGDELTAFTTTATRATRSPAWAARPGYPAS